MELQLNEMLLQLAEREEKRKGISKVIVRKLVKAQAEEALSTVERYGGTIYLIPKEENVFLGFSKAKLKEALCKSTGTDKDFYMH